MQSQTFSIDGVTIGEKTQCYVIAEIGHNHQGDVEKCKQLFDAAKGCGANAVKLQKRDNKSLFTRVMYASPYASEHAFGDTYGTHREALEFGREEYAELMDYADEIGITFFSTAFDMASADFLADLNVPAYKIASGDLRSIPLLRHVASIGKPMIISTGGGTMEDVRRAYDTIMPINQNLCIMQCTAGYPPEFSELNLKVIETYRDTFPDTVIGFSSHDSGISMPLIAYMLGARMVEKHFTLNRAMKGSDHAFSLEPPGLRRLVRDLHRTVESLGDGVKQTYPSEERPLYKMAKSLVAARDLPADTVLTEADIVMKTPNDGLSPLHFDDLMGRRLVSPMKADEAFAMEKTVAASAA